MATKAPVNKGAVLALSCAAQFMVVLDVAIVNVALPSIQRDLGIGQSTVQWIVVAYGLMLGGFLLLGGKLADLVGRRGVLLTGLALFSAASLLAGLAGSAELLIGARALQGFGAALIPPAALSILAVTFTEGAERNRAFGLYSAVTGVSVACSPTARAGTGSSSSTFRSASSCSRWRWSSCPSTLATAPGTNPSTSPASSPARRRTLDRRSAPSTPPSGGSSPSRQSVRWRPRSPSRAARRGRSSSSRLRSTAAGSERPPTGLIELPGRSDRSSRAPQEG